ncbi:hypothetical protein [Parapedobacter indicus]|uniref:hypothetical protein n=1 Tax=Parapedobacter indicus TaxID=1477437 RepID=UPI000B814E30|nr:hypothetical protein [Parapedobacter indicus]
MDGTWGNLVCYPAIIGQSHIGATIYAQTPVACSFAWDKRETSEPQHAPNGFVLFGAAPH